MARPKKDVTKDHMVRLRMTDDEYNRLASYATKNNETMSQVISRALEEEYKSSETKK